MQLIDVKQHNISLDQVSDYALIVLNTLIENGFEAYLVGGGVRDLLVGLEPKDFDVVTNALPEQIIELFNRCRMIGRRFRLVHVYFGQEYIEVATFRGNISVNDGERLVKNGLLVRDNVYGSLEEDAERRDFTINALYLSNIDGVVKDFSGGYNDVQNKCLRLIGNPAERYNEDPVRMLRAVRFAIKLGFTIHPETLKPINEMRTLLYQIPPARLFDELSKLFLSGVAHECYQKLCELGLFEMLFPKTAQLMDKELNEFISYVLINTDLRLKANKHVTPSFLIATLLWPVFEKYRKKMMKSSPKRSREASEKAAKITIEEQIARVAIPKRFYLAIKEIWLLQPKFYSRSGKKTMRFLRHRRFRAAYDFLLARSKIDKELVELCDWWTLIQEVDNDTKMQMILDCRSKNNSDNQISNVMV